MIETPESGADRLAHVLNVVDREGISDPQEARKRLKLLGMDNEKTIAAVEKELRLREAKRLTAELRAEPVTRDEKSKTQNDGSE